MAAVHPGPDKLPDGQIFHAAGESSGGWTIIAVHESKESWEAFRDNVLFYEYFHGDTGHGLGAAHQTGWSGLVALLLQPNIRGTARKEVE